MGIINEHFEIPGKDFPPQEFMELKTQQGQINWLAQFLMSVNNVFDNVSGTVTTLEPDASAYVEIEFDDENNSATFDFYVPQGQTGAPGHLESLTATAQTLAAGESATATVVFDETTQSGAFTFGIPTTNPTDAQVTSAVNSWLTAHPEATTTVQDNSITNAKLVQNGGVLESVSNLEKYLALSLQDFTINGTWETGKYINATNGAVGTNVTCGAVGKMDISEYAGTEIIISYYNYHPAGFAFYDANNTYISGSSESSYAGMYVLVQDIVKVPENAKYIAMTTIYDYETHQDDYYIKCYSKSPLYSEFGPRLYSLQDALMNWYQGNKFPIAFMGDSTTDGWRTTDWTANVLGTDHTTGYLYTDILQSLLREECSNNTLRVYNAGFTGRDIAWALENFEAEFINNGVAYSDVKMIGISYGINDGISNLTTYKAFKSNLLALIKKCYKYGIQPFLVTTQATYENSTRSEGFSNIAANQIKKDVAEKLGLEIIDTDKYTSRFITWSKNKLLDIIPDTCHFADVGHAFEGGMYFWQMVPRTIYIDESNTRIYPYTHGISSDIQWADGNYGMLFANNDGSNKFKTQIRYTNTNQDDICLLKARVYLNKPMDIKAVFGTFNTQYLIIDGETVTPTADSQILANLDMGLHIIKIMSGASATNYLYGLIFTT